MRGCPHAARTAAQDDHTKVITGAVPLRRVELECSPSELAELETWSAGPSGASQPPGQEPKARHLKGREPWDRHNGLIAFSHAQFRGPVRLLGRPNVALLESRRRRRQPEFWTRVGPRAGHETLTHELCGFFSAGLRHRVMPFLERCLAARSEWTRRDSNLQVPSSDPRGSYDASRVVDNGALEPDGPCWSTIEPRDRNLAAESRGTDWRR